MLTLKTYDLPFGMKYIRKWKWARYIPFSPTFVQVDSPIIACTCCKKGNDNNGDQNYKMEDDSYENSKISISET